jgi:hypothetical protein
MMTDAAAQSAPIRYLLRLAAGRSRTPDLVLRRGAPRAVFGAGRDALWQIDGAEVGPLHVLFAFNGLDLYVAAAPGADARLDGAPLPERWIPVRRVVQIELGRARIAILPRPALPKAKPAADGPHEPTDASDDAVTEPFARDAAEGDTTAVTNPDVLRALREALSR